MPQSPSEHLHLFYAQLQSHLPSSTFPFPLFLYSQLTTSRPFTTQPLTPQESQAVLAAQRKRRPTSPHLTIYRLSINYFTSPLNRITGTLLSGTFYIFGFSYLVAPLFGFHFDTATLVAAFGDLSEPVKIAAKFLMAFPFTFHGVNGVGHLIWDTGRRFARKQIVGQGWTVVGISVVSAIYLAIMV